MTSILTLGAINAFASGLLFGKTWALLLYWPDLRSYGWAELIAACTYPLFGFPLRKQLPNARLLPGVLNLGLLLALLTIITALWS